LQKAREKGERERARERDSERELRATMHAYFDIWIVK